MIIIIIMIIIKLEIQGKVCSLVNSLKTSLKDSNIPAKPTLFYPSYSGSIISPILINFIISNG